MTPELSNKLAILRHACATNTATREQMREAIEALREVRGAASVASAKKPVAKAMGIAAVNTTELLKGLGDMVKKP